MSLSIDTELQDRLKQVAKKRNVSVSKLVRDIMDKYLGDEDSTATIILKVPVALKEDPDALQKWFDQRISGVVKALTA